MSKLEEKNVNFVKLATMQKVSLKNILFYKTFSLFYL